MCVNVCRHGGGEEMDLGVCVCVCVCMYKSIPFDDDIDEWLLACFIHLVGSWSE